MGITNVLLNWWYGLHGKFPETIEYGSHGKTVSMWQTVLGLDIPDGSFGPITVEKTKAWQADHGIDPDGVVGPLTWTAASKTFGSAATPKSSGGAPHGTRPLPQVVANKPAITAFALETLHNGLVRMGETARRTIEGIDVLARIEPHTWTHRNGKLVTHLDPPIRGVTLYQIVDPSDFGADEVVWRVSEHGSDVAGEYRTKTDQGGTMDQIGDDFNSRPAGFMSPVGAEAGSRGEHGCPSDIRGNPSKYKIKR
jgi:peptidoglycan hydrolase-like protein with peptidoglycan-binding domain